MEMTILKVPEKTFSHFLSEVHGADGKPKVRSLLRHNLTTDTAVGFTNRRDWQSKLMGGGFAPFAAAVGAATASTATTITAAGAFPTAGQGLAGCMVVVSANSAGAGSTVWGIIQSNTATVLTVDQWYNGGTWAVGTTPNATGNYVILPGQAPAMWLAVTSDAVAPAASDTVLATEATTNGFARALAVYAHTAAASTFTLQNVFTASGALTVNKEAVFGSLVSGKGVMPFESAEPTPPALISGDTLTQTVTVSVG